MSVRLNKFEAILKSLRRFHSNSRITCSKIDVGRVISKIARCGAEADTKGDRITPSMPLEGWITNPTSCEWRYHGAFGAFDASGRFCLGVCLSRTAKSLHSIFHIAECFCLPTGTTRSAVICIYLCSNSKQRIALIGYDKSAIIFPISLSTFHYRPLLEIKFQNHRNSRNILSFWKNFKEIRITFSFYFFFPDSFEKVLKVLKENLDQPNDISDFVSSILFHLFSLLFVSPSNYQRYLSTITFRGFKHSLPQWP